jgi:hypothetical protein
MSEVAGNSNEKGSRRRRPRGPRPAGDAPAAAPRDAATGEEAPKRERVPIVPFPASQVGTRRIGTVAVTIRNSRFHFGFISSGIDEAAEDATLPRIYYNRSCISEEGLTIYRGYEVEFTVGTDEGGRQIAQDVKLTARGAAIKVERDAAAAARKAERKAEQAAAAPPATHGALEPEGGAKRRKKKRAPRRRTTTEGAEGAAPREPREPRADRKVVKFNVVVDGEGKKAEVDFPIYLAIGRLKSIAAKAAGAPLDHSVYLITPEAPRGVFLTRAVLNTCEDGATILLTAKRPEDTIVATA